MVIPSIYMISLLFMSNIFMSFAWYWHLKDLTNKSIYLAVIISWLIAFLEYMFLIPALRIGGSVLSLSQIKITQEVITLIVFIPFSIIVMNQPFKLDFIWAMFCMFGAVYFIFR